MFIKAVKEYFLKRQLRSLIDKNITHLSAQEIDDWITQVIAQQNDNDFNFDSLFSEILAKELLVKMGLYDLGEEASTPIKESALNNTPPIHHIIKDIEYATTSEYLPTDKLYHKKSYINNIIARGIYKLNIFQPDKIDDLLSRLQLLKSPLKIKYMEPVLSNLDKKIKDINHKGKLSIYLYEILLNKTDVSTSIKEFDVFIKQCIKEEQHLQYVDLRTIQNESSRHSRLNTIKNGWANGVWCCAPDNRGSECQHKHLNNKIFPLEQGLYNNLTDQFEFPDESIDCYCYFIMDI